jgi:hypothetical protein
MFSNWTISPTISIGLLPTHCMSSGLSSSTSSVVKVEPRSRFLGSFRKNVGI